MDNLIKSISAIYDAAMDASTWPDALFEMCEISCAEGFNLFLLDHDNGLEPSISQSASPDELLADYNSHHVARDPGVDYFDKNPDCDFYYDYQHTAEDQIDASQYYGWLQRMGGSRHYLGKAFKFGSRFSSIVCTTQP